MSDDSNFEIGPILHHAQGARVCDLCGITIPSGSPYWKWTVVRGSSHDDQDFTSYRCHESCSVLWWKSQDGSFPPPDMGLFDALFKAVG